MKLVNGNHSDNYEGSRYITDGASLTSLVYCILSPFVYVYVSVWRCLRRWGLRFKGGRDWNPFFHYMFEDKIKFFKGVAVLRSE